jgi:hypothetical protein
MAKKPAKNLVYFILYITLITELLIVIQERDELEEEEHRIRDSLIVNVGDAIKQPLILQVDPLTSREKDLKEYSVVNLKAIGLVSKEERNTIKYFVKLSDKSKTPPNFPKDGIKTDQIDNPFFIIERDADGGGRFKFKIDVEGEYKFIAKCEVERTVPAYLPPRLREMLEEYIKDHKIAKSEEVEFLIKVTAQGVQRQGFQRLD